MLSLVVSAKVRKPKTIYYYTYLGRYINIFKRIICLKMYSRKGYRSHLKNNMFIPPQDTINGK